MNRTPRRSGAPAPAGAAAALCFGAALLFAVPDARATRERPPTAHTGAFGEPSCHTCHFDADLNAGPGKLAIRGAPDRFEPGHTYPLAVLLVEPGMLAAGFQLTARFQDGRQAGTLSVPDGEQNRLDITTDRAVQYAHHVYDGTLPAAPDTARWVVLWTAPDSLEPVLFHVAANAVDDDMSPLGDHVYTAAVRIAP